MNRRMLVATGPAAAAFSMLAATAAFAQAPAASPGELRSVLRADEAVVVRVADGGSLQGTVIEVTDSALSLQTGGRTEVLPFDRVREVRARRNDPFWNGVLIGLAVGAAGGLVPDYYDDCEECHDSLYGSAAVGAGIGLLVDALLRQSPVVYRAPSGEPAVSLLFKPGRRGAAVALSVSF